MTCCDIIIIELQWVALECDHIYSELQMVIVTQKLNCNPSCKTPIFLIVNLE
jgi:hypothetical protein